MNLISDNTHDTLDKIHAVVSFLAYVKTLKQMEHDEQQTYGEYLILEACQEALAHLKGGRS